MEASPSSVPAVAKPVQADDTLEPMASFHEAHPIDELLISEAFARDIARRYVPELTDRCDAIASVFAGRFSPSEKDAAADQAHSRVNLVTAAPRLQTQLSSVGPKPVTQVPLPDEEQSETQTSEWVRCLEELEKSLQAPPAVEQQSETQQPSPSCSGTLHVMPNPVKAEQQSATQQPVPDGDNGQLAVAPIKGPHACGLAMLHSDPASPWGDPFNQSESARLQRLLNTEIRGSDTPKSPAKTATATQPGPSVHTDSMKGRPLADGKVMTPAPPAAQRVGPARPCGAKLLEAGAVPVRRFSGGRAMSVSDDSPHIDKSISGILGKHSGILTQQSKIAAKAHQIAVRYVHELVANCDAIASCFADAGRQCSPDQPSSPSTRPEVQPPPTREKAVARWTHSTEAGHVVSTREQAARAKRLPESYLLPISSPNPWDESSEHSEGARLQRLLDPDLRRRGRLKAVLKAPPALTDCGNPKSAVGPAWPLVPVIPRAGPARSGKTSGSILTQPPWRPGSAPSRGRKQAPRRLQEDALALVASDRNRSDDTGRQLEKIVDAPPNRSPVPRTADQRQRSTRRASATAFTYTGSYSHPLLGDSSLKITVWLESMIMGHWIADGQLQQIWVIRTGKAVLFKEAEEGRIQMEGTMSEENHQIFIRGLVIVEGKRGGGFQLKAEGLIKEVPAELLTQIPDAQKLRFLGNPSTQGIAPEHLQSEDKGADKLERLEEVKSQMKMRYSVVMNPDKEEERKELLNNAVNIFKLAYVAEDLGAKVNEVVLVKSVFDSFDYDASGQLERKEFESAVVRLLELQRFENTTDEDLQDRMRAITEFHFREADKDHDGAILFPEFIKWYTAHSFDEGYLLSEEDREVRKLARQYGISPNYVESIKKSFEAFDKDKSSQIDINEFKQVLHKAMKVPNNVELPESRVRYFWQELDADCSGTCEFPEFLAWWLRYFEETSDQKNPGQEFYRQVRRMGPKYLDPPAYRIREDDESSSSDDDDQPPLVPNVTAISIVPASDS